MAKRAATVVPRLRFPGFLGAPEWDEYLLEDLEKYGWLELGRGNVISASDMRDIPGTYPVYSSSIKNDGHMGSYGRFMFDEELISWSVDGGGNFFHRPRHKFSVTNVSGYVRLNTDRLLYRFLAIQLQSLHAAHTFDYQFKAHPSVIRKLYRLGVPSLAEQQKIAGCLTALDEVIAAQGRKVEALKVHKRGLMQRLFPREGETRPRLRFPEFRDAPEWEVASIGNRSKSFSGGTPSTTDKSYYGGGIPFIRSAEIGSEEAELSLTESGLKNSSAKLVKPGDVLVALYGANSGDVALAKISGAINQAILCIRPEGNNAFLYHFLTAKKTWITSTYLQGGQGNLSGDIVKSIVLQFPSVEEQQRIADCLSSLDTQITAESSQLAALKSHKQGLMQQLFPAPDATTA